MRQTETQNRISHSVITETIDQKGRGIYQYPIKPPLVELDLPPLSQNPILSPVITETIDEKGRSIHQYPVELPLVELDLPPFPQNPMLSPVDVEVRERTAERKEKEEPETLEEHIAHFDKNWRELKLPESWYIVSRKMGFSIKSQMELLTDMSQEGKTLWLERTKRDLLGFYLEYLDSDHVVYPVTYEIETGEDGVRRMVDKRYRKGPSEMTSDQERNGEVKGAMQKVEKFFLQEKEGDGEIGMMGSSRGPSGLKTDDGKAITYPDSYYFLWQRTGNVINGVTIQTDFSLNECAQVAELLKRETSGVERSGSEYVNMLALLDSPKHRKMSLIDMVNILKSVRKDNFYRSPFAFKDKRWEAIIADVQKGEALYDFNLTVEGYQKELEAYCLREDVSETDINKALAATLLRAGKHFLIDGKEEEIQGKKAKQSSSRSTFSRGSGGGYSGVVSAMESASGCNGGGGERISVMSGGSTREGSVESGESCPKIECGRCEWEADEDEIKKIQAGELSECPSCGWEPGGYSYDEIS